MSMLALDLNSLEDTAKLAQRLAPDFIAHMHRHGRSLAVLLMGTLGAGKTTFVRHLVANLPDGENAEVSSPSFTLCNIYPTTPEVLHYDLYRLPPGGASEELEEALDALDILDSEKNIAASGKTGSRLLLIEWAEHLQQNFVPANRLEIYWHSLPAAQISDNGAASHSNLEENLKPDSTAKKDIRRVILKAEGLAADLQIFKTNH